MPIYEYRCDECDSTFEMRRPASESGLTAVCPDGHASAKRLLSVFATTGRSSGSAFEAGPQSAGGGGCGGNCACAAAGRV